MRKIELMKIPRQEPTEEMLKAFRNDLPVDERWYGIRYNYGSYMMALVVGEIMKVSIFVRGIDRKKLVLRFEIYISTKEKKWQTYDHEKKGWRKADIYNLLAYEYTPPWCAREDEEKIKKFLDSEKDSYNAIRKTQERWRTEKRNAEEQKKFAEWDAKMDTVPKALPLDWYDWIETVGFKKQQYIFYETNGKDKECFCSLCKCRYTTREKVRHNEKGDCLICGNTATYKAYNKQKHLKDENQVSLLQKVEGGYVLRVFNSTIKRAWVDYWEPDIYYHEFYRKFYDEELKVTVRYSKENYKQRIYRWCKSSTCMWGRENDNVLYTNNIRETLGERIAHLDTDEILSLPKNGNRINAEKIIRRLMELSCLEYIQKAGLETIANELVTMIEPSTIYNIAATSLTEFFKMNKQRVLRLRQIDGNRYAVEALRHEENTGDKVSTEHLEYISKNLIEVERLQMNRTGLTLARTLNYLQKQAMKSEDRILNVIAMYKDYLDMAEQKNMCLTDEIVCKVKDLRRAHDQLLLEKDAEKNRERDRKVDENFPQIAARKEENEKRFAFTTKKYQIIIPEKASDITKEGRLQHHCVGASDYYMREMARGKTYILFLRKKGNLDLPYYTLEVNPDGTIVQAYAEYNRKPDWETIEAVLKRFTRTVKKRVAKSEMQKAV